MREWEVRTSCRVWRGRYVIRGGVDRIANDIAGLQQSRFPGLEPGKVSLRVVTMAVMAVLAEECCEDGVTAAELSFLLTTCLGRPISPARIEDEMELLSGLVWTGAWGGETLYVLEKRGLRFFESARVMAISDADAKNGDLTKYRGAEEGGVLQQIDPSITADPAPHARYRVVG
ncbi:hypothetical protein [Thalassospira alkalitolerans]|uniref:Uncharacterized protein n=1 Tax=Thalassospira alkalitolerans TaxID=1293890 RepID=A0A1Y2LF53_9PROT|nr:hypothetical protein [Thalassospira alkalitolerans]OSQ48431.1 hypothetical protein TALK_09275 [Thalassospira alkalitolerans]